MVIRQRKLVQVNVTAGRGSTGVIAEEIGRLAVARGWDSTIVYGREPHGESASRLIRVGTDFDIKEHGFESRLLDNHGLASRRATRHLVKQLSELKPDIVHLHNIHGYFLNYPILFKWLKDWAGQVVWTLHDCWPFTGHCAHFMFEGCDKWLTECNHCPLKKAYPSTWLLDCSQRNFRWKKKLFPSIGSALTLVSCSQCVADYARQSFFKDTDILCINNGVDTEIFKLSMRPKRKRLIGVCSVWTRSKGLDDFVQLRRLLPADYEIVLVGLTEGLISKLPEGITGVCRTANRSELAAMYAESAVFVNPTYEDNFPTVNIEALACGTPVVTYRTGGSPEAIDEHTGIVVEKGDVNALADAVMKVMNNPNFFTAENCRKRAEQYFNKDIQFGKYVDLYNRLLLTDNQMITPPPHVPR